MSKRVIICTNCKSKLRIAESTSKPKVRCPKCRSVIVLASVSTPVAGGIESLPELDPLLSFSIDEPFEKSSMDSSSSSGAKMPAKNFGEPKSSFKREKIVFDNKTTHFGDRYYFTYWYQNAKGFAGKFQDNIRKSITQSEFPDVKIQPISASNQAGCLSFLFPAFQFNGIAFWSQREELKSYRCIYKANEYGNVLHISLIFYNHFDAGCNPFAHLGRGLKKKDDLETAEYEEAFTRFVWMVLLESITQLDVEPIKSKIDEFRGRHTESNSGIGNILNLL